MNEIINGGRRDREEDSSSQGSEDGTGGIRMGGLVGRGRDERARDTGSGNTDDVPLPIDPNGNRNIQISSVQE